MHSLVLAVGYNKPPCALPRLLHLAYYYVLLASLFLVLENICDMDE
jgi:hypothetical protein